MNREILLAKAPSSPRTQSYLRIKNNNLINRLASFAFLASLREQMGKEFYE